jgi:CTD nuclear envelope phosphatase 1
MTPFHLQKTLILDLDETLIHSTSRAMTIQSSGVGGGSGLVGINLSGLFGSQRRGGGGARGEGHTVEVVLGGRSTLYHVYKRPFVDHFLKKVSLSLIRMAGTSS